MGESDIRSVSEIDNSTIRSTFPLTTGTPESAAMVTKMGCAHLLLIWLKSAFADNSTFAEAVKLRSGAFPNERECKLSFLPPAC